MKILRFEISSKISLSQNKKRKKEKKKLFPTPFFFVEMNDTESLLDDQTNLQKPLNYDTLFEDLRKSHYLLSYFRCFTHEGSCTYTHLRLINDLPLNERISLTLGCWSLSASLLSLYFFGKEAFFILLMTNVVSVALKCKLDTCLLGVSQATNRTFQCFRILFHFLEQITYAIIVLVSLNFSLIEVFGLRLLQLLDSLWKTSLDTSEYLRSNIYVGGEAQIIAGRESITSVTLRELVDDFRESKEGYCFLRVLNVSDREAFLRRLVESDYLDIYQRKAIKLGHWILIMKSLKLTAKYVVYRHAYWGENAGNAKISPRLTKYVIPMWYFRRYVPEEEEQVLNFDAILRLFSRLCLSEPEVSILLCRHMEIHHMEKFTYDGLLHSNWENKNYKIPNEFYQ